MLPDGSMVELGGKELDVPGYDLHGVFVGSEGTLGIATEITVRVMPSPESVRTLVAFFDTARPRRPRRLGHRRGGHGARRDRDDGQPAIRASEAMASAGWPTDAGAALLVELDGPESEIEARFEQLTEICERRGSDACASRATTPSATLFWKMRKAAFPAMGRLSSHYYVQDSVIPRTKLPRSSTASPSSPPSTT